MSSLAFARSVEAPILPFCGDGHAPTFHSWGMLELGLHDWRPPSPMPCNRERTPMIRSICRKVWIGLLGLACFGMTAEARAWDHPLVRVSNVRFNIHVEMSTTPTAPPPIAPWYAYFPADARMLPPPQASPYPPWPMQFPPQIPTPDPSKDAPRRSDASSVPPAPILTQHWPGYAGHGFNLQPVGYVPAMAPSYWYQGR